jgi:cysteine synthase A
MTRILDRLTERIGNTPLVRLQSTARAHGALAEVVLKLEYLNPLGSVKDRTAFSLIEDARASGRVNQDTVLIEPTTGNTGIGLAFAAAAAGLRLILVMPDRVSAERIRLAKLLGAKVVLSPGAEFMLGCIAKAEELQRRIPGSVILQQFRNPANPSIHERTTGPEIWRDTGGDVDVVVAGVGTGGTLMGVARALKPLRPGLRCVAVQPARSPVLGGGEPGPHQLTGMGPNFVSPLVEKGLIDEILSAWEEDAVTTLRQCARLDGLPIGVSSGAVVWAALQLAKRPEHAGQRIVAICASGSERYLSTPLLAEIGLESDDVSAWFNEG